MKTKQIIRLFSVFIALSILGSCGNSSNKVTAKRTQVSPAEAKDTSSDASKEYKTKTGKTIMISETHPVGQSLSTIKISTKGFQYNYSEIYKDRDLISDIYLSDLDGDGFPKWTGGPINYARQKGIYSDLISEIDSRKAG